MKTLSLPHTLTPKAKGKTGSENLSETDTNLELDAKHCRESKKQICHQPPTPTQTVTEIKSVDIITPTASLFLFSQYVIHRKVIHACSSSPFDSGNIPLFT